MRRKIMGRIKSHLHDWLEEYGYELGYDMSNAPNLQDLWWVADGGVDAEEYWDKRWEDKD